MGLKRVEITNEFVITGEQLHDFIRFNESGIKRLQDEIRLNPLSDHDVEISKKERVRVLDIYEQKLWIELQFCGVSREVFSGICLNIRHKIESIGDKS